MSSSRRGPHGRVRRPARPAPRRSPRTATVVGETARVFGLPAQLVRRRSGIAGWGVYTREPIAKNTRVIDYAGELISHRESDRRERVHLKAGHIWCFTVDRTRVRDASVGGNLARFINHACKPNCYAQVADGVIWIRAARTIRAGEELTYDYHTEGAARIPCRCRPGCMRML